MADLFVGATNVTIRVKTDIDMSSNTELSIRFCKPDGTTVTKASADGVVIGSSTITDDDLGALTANKYLEYPTEASFLDTAGIWKAQAIYTDTATTPDSIYYGNIAQFTVKNTC